MGHDDGEAATLAHIEQLVGEEHRLLEQATRTDDQERRLRTLQVKLDQCWDLLRQRRALVETGQDPSTAHVRSADVVEKYTG